MTTPLEKPRAEGAAGGQRARLLACLALGGIVVYVILDVVSQALPPHYSPISQAESVLAVGPYGFIMSINFVVRGLLSLAAVLALHDGLPRRARSMAGEILLTVWAVGALVLSVSPTDLPGQHPTLHGLIHLVAAFIAFVSGAVGALLVSLRLGASGYLRALAPAALALAIVAIVLLVVFILSIGAAQYYGLTERLFLGSILLWLAVVAMGLLQIPPAAVQSHSTTK